MNLRFQTKATHPPGLSYGAEIQMTGVTSGSGSKLGCVSGEGGWDHSEGAGVSGISFSRLITEALPEFSYPPSLVEIDQVKCE